MMTNPEIPPLPPDDSDRTKLREWIKRNIDMEEVWPLEENNSAAQAEAEQLIHGVDEYLAASKDGLSRDEVKYFLQKLDTAIAISNDPEAREIRRNLIERYGDSK